MAQYGTSGKQALACDEGYTVVGRKPRPTNGPPNSISQYNRTRAPTQYTTSRLPPGNNRPQTFMANSVAAPSNAQSRRTGATQRMYFHGKKSNLRPSDFNIGDVISAPHAVPNLDGQMTEDNQAHVHSKITGPMCVKFRPMIIIGIFETHLICIPLMTNSGSYLDNVRPWQKLEAIWLCGWGGKNQVPDGTPEEKLLVCDKAHAKPSVVYPSQPCTIMLNYQIDKYSYGSIRPHDVTTLLNLYDFLHRTLMRIPYQKHEAELKRYWVDQGKEAANDAVAQMSRMSINGAAPKAPKEQGKRLLQRI